MARQAMGEGHSRRSFLTSTGVAAAVSLAGFVGVTQGSGQEDPSRITITLATEPLTLDPQNHEHTETDIVMRHAYEKLVTRDPDGEIIPHLADDWERIEPGHVRFWLVDETITFHEGGELTAEDVAYSINRIVDDDVGIASPQRTFIAGVDSAEVAEDGAAVDVFSPDLNAGVFDNFAAVGGQVIQQSWVEEADDETIATEMNGTGPYRLEEYTEDVEVFLTRYEDYWGEQPDAEEVLITWTGEASPRVSALLAGETDIAVNVPPEEVPRVEESEEAYVATVPSARSIFCPMNANREPFTSVEFRQAMNYAYDQERMIEDVLMGFAEPTSQPVLEGMVGYNEELDPYPHDPERAEELVEESGFAGAEIVLHTPTDRYLKDVETAQALASDINGLENVSCEAELRDFGALVDETFDVDEDTGPSFWLIGWGNTAFHPDFIVEPHLTPDGITRQYVDDEDGNELFAEARSEEDDDRREELYQELMAHYHEQAPWVFSHQQFSVYGLNERIEWEPRPDEVVDAQAMGL